MLTLALLALLSGSLVYCVLTIVAAARYRAVCPPDPAEWPPVSILKPMAGAEDGLEENLRSFFEQKYPRFEILFAARSAADPALAIAERLRARYPAVPSRLIVTGEPPYPNAKVYSLDRMLAEARYDIIVMADSDVRVGPHLLATLSAEFSDPRAGIITCPYRAAPGRSFWSALEAVGLNTEFIAGVVVARMLDGVKFALGPTIAARRETLRDIGGFDALKEFLAEDFMMGKLAAGRGWQVLLSSYVIEHRIGSQALGANARHRLRWNRSTRCSRPWGYIGQVFTNPLPLALLLWAAAPAWWPAVAVTAVFRAAAALAASLALRNPLTARAWLLLPLQDVLSFAFWMAGFFGNTIVWRGRPYSLHRDGRFTPMAP